MDQTEADVAQPDEPLGTAIESYKCLHRLKLKYSQPHLSEQQILNKVTNMAKHVFTSLISDQAKKAFYTWLDLRKTAGETVTLEAFVAYITELEGKDKTYILTYPNSIPSAQQPNVHLYKTYFYFLEPTLPLFCVW